MPKKKPIKKRGKKKVTGKVVSGQELETVRDDESPKSIKPGGKGNVMIGTLNVITSPVKGLIDPVHKVCYEPLKSHYDRKYRKPHPKHHSKVLILDLVLLTILGALIVFWLFARFLWPLFPQPKIVTIKSQTPQTIISGKLTDFKITYRNDSEQPLADSQMEINMPNGFVLDPDDGSDPEDSDSNYVRVLNIGTISPNSGGEITFSGRLYAPVGSNQTMTTSMSFWRAGDTGPKRIAQNTTWLVEESLFHLALRPEEKIIRGRQISIGLPYANLDERAVSAIIRLAMPDDFVMTGSNPARSSVNEWNLGQLEPGEKGSIDIHGYFRSATSKPAVPAFTISAFILENDAQKLIQEVLQSIDTLSGGFEIEQTMVSHTEAFAINPGSDIKIVMRYMNSGLKPISDIKISLELDKNFLADSPITVWDSKSNPELKILKPNSAKAIMFESRLKDDLTEALSNGGQTALNIKATAEYFLDDSTTRPVLAETSTISLPINTTLNLDAAAFYWTKDGDQVGSGPMPPQVGEVTKYRVFVQASSALNTTTETTFEAFLPTDVEWTGRYSVTLGKPPAFLPAERRLVWNLGDLPAKNESSETGASFEIALTPKTSSLETILMRDLKLCGKDKLTGVRLCTRLNEVTNRLKY